MNKDIKSTRIHVYGGHKYDGEYVPEKLRNTIEIEYDTDGRVVSRKYFDCSEDIRENVYQTRRRMENGLVICEEFDSNNEIVAYNKFDRDGHLMESLWLNGQKFFYIYDEKGNEIEHYSLDDDGKLLYRARYEYDSNDRMIRSFHENEEPCSCQHYYSKDITGNIVQTTHGDNDESVSSQIKEREEEYAFETKDVIFEDKYTISVRLIDKKGNEQYALSWAEDECVDSCHMTYFNYDERGNWIMKIETPLINLDNPELDSSISNECTISVREIEYYSDNYNLFLL